MELKIGEKTYALYIGFDFIRELDKRYQENFLGVSFGFGVMKILTYLSQRNPIAVLDFIEAATITESVSPTEKDIEQMFQTWNVDELCENFINVLEKSSLTSPILKRIRAEAKEAEIIGATPETIQKNLTPKKPIKK